MAEQYIYKVEGMTCSKCAAAIKDQIGLHVEDFKVSVKTKKIALVGGIAGDVDALNALLQDSGGHYTLIADQSKPMSDSASVALVAKVFDWISTYKPLLLILALIIAGTLYLDIRTPFGGNFETLMMDFMGLFFILFGFFKLFDVSGFQKSFASYDVVAARFSPYGYAYPFIEIGLGVAYLMNWTTLWLHLFVFVLMGVGLVGIFKTLRSGQKIQCACVGTQFNLPMSSVTLIENAAMALMALWMAWSAYSFM
jgi:copper chaperone CopZ